MATAFGSVSGAQKYFFDRAAVFEAVDKQRAKILAKIGAYVRRQAQSSLRYRKGSSAPGRPPSVHRSASGGKTGRRAGQTYSPLKDFLYFAYDPTTRSVVVGPAATNQVFFDSATRPVTGSVPQALEHGGAVTVLEWLSPYDNQWYRADLRSKRRLGERPKRFRTYSVAARPFMRPALEAVVPGFAKFFRDKVTR